MPLHPNIIFSGSFAELAGVTDALPEGGNGISFAPTLLGRKSKQRQHEQLYWAFYERGGARALLMGKWKLIEQPMHTPVQLYDVDADIAETRDLALEHPELLAELVRHLDEADEPSEQWKFPAAKEKKKE